MSVTAKNDFGQLADIRKRLDEAEETIRAIRDGEVDAFVMKTAGEDTVFALEVAADPYRTLVERMQQGAATLGTDQAIFFCNRRFSDMLRTSPEELFGQPFRAFLDGSDLTLWDALTREAAEKGASYGEIVLTSATAARVPVHVALAPFGKGNVGLSVMVTDLTDRKRHEAVLAAETLSKSILEQAADAIIVCDESGTIIRTSQVAQELCGRNAMLLSFDAVFDLMTSPQARAADASARVSLREVLSGTTIRGLEVELRREDGSTADLLMSAAPLKQDAATIGCVVTLTDITDQKAAEKVLRESDRRKDEFLAMLGHEMRNALGPVRNACQILKRQDATTEYLETAQAMLDRQVTHMTRLIEDLLDVSRIAQGKILLRKELFDLSALVRTTVADCRPGLEAGDLSVEVDVPEHPIWIPGDPVRVAQVLGNVVQNAGKFTDPGGRVSIRLERAVGTATLQVRDTGIGMSLDTVSRVFDFYSQSEGSRDRSRGGLGLGMALARGLVELHGGRIRAESGGPGQGSTFTIVLPLGGSPAAVGSPDTTTGASRGPLRILIIEDNADMAESLSILLGLEGHRVERAQTGSAGLELARSMRPDVVLCDLGLPGGMDGWAVAARLREEPGASGAFLIALSGYAQEEDRARAAEAGFDLHLSKPVSLERLSEVLSSIGKR